MSATTDRWETQRVDRDEGHIVYEVWGVRQGFLFGISDELNPNAKAHAEDIVAARNGPWQPIETAPKDGSYIDVWVGGEFPKRITDVSWRKPTDSEWWVHGGDELQHPRASWFDAFGPLGKSSPPTHWMRSPSQPVASIKAAAQ